jgi:thiol-disulfide isomerase/thioredoxin
LKYIIISISIIILLLFFLKIFGIHIGIAKFENKSKIKVINNSYLDTFKNFIDTSDYDYITGKAIFFNTWASWCGSCIKEIPILNQLQLQYTDNEKIVFVSYCNDLKSGSIPEFLKKRNLELNYRFLNSSEGLRGSLRTILSGNPDLPHIDPLTDSVLMNFIIDKNEKVLFYKNGGLTDDDLLTISSILNEV